MTDNSSATRAVPGLVSVVIPIGGVDRWLDIAVESALAQSDVDLEVVAVFNNGAEVPEGWAPLTDPRVRVVFDPAPLGPGGAGQAGIDAARGEFLACLDADDRMRAGRLRRQVEALSSDPEIVLVSSQVDWIDGDGRVTGKFDLPSGSDVREELIKLNVAPHSAWLARMDVVREVGGYDLGMNQMEDYDLLMRLGVEGRIAVLSEVLTEYRLHPEQLSRAVRPNGHYVRKIADRRRALGDAIGVSRGRVALARAWWETQQWIMYLGRKVRG